MKCLRCGKCCLDSLVVVVKPESVKEDLNINELTQDDVLSIEGPKDKCPHLKWDGDIACCSIHHYKWYKYTPCFSHGQIGKKNAPCRTGVYLKNNPEILNCLKNKVNKKGK